MKCDRFKETLEKVFSSFFSMTNRRIHSWWLPNELLNYLWVKVWSCKQKNIIASIGHPRRAYESTTSMSHDGCAIENKWMSCTRRYVAMKQFLTTSTEEKKVSSYAKSLFLKRIYLITEISYVYTTYIYVKINNCKQSVDSAFVPE